MKRIGRIQQYRRWQQQRAEKEEEKRRLRSEYLRSKRNARQGVPRASRSLVADRRQVPLQKGYTTVVAPGTLSMVRYPEQCSAFFGKLHAYHRAKRPVFVSLHNTDVIDHAAIVVLVAIMVQFRVANIDFNGDLPRKSEPRRTLQQSGFLDTIYGDLDESETYSIGTAERSLFTHASKQVRSPFTAGLIERAALTVWGERRRCQGIQRALLELMHNTNNHASPARKGEKHWWLSVHRRRAKFGRPGTATFSFVDFGVGVIKSLDNKRSGEQFHGWRRSSFFQLVPPGADNADVMRLILAGELHRTVTGKDFRGKGLPGIAQALRRNQFSNLIIVTNDVFANVSDDEFRIINPPFPGTLVIWELEKTNQSSPYAESHE